MLYGCILPQVISSCFKNPGWDINTGLKQVGAGKFKAEVNKYHKVKLSMQGSKIQVYYDGKLVIDAKDESHKKGTIAVGSQDRVIYFDNDNIKVEGPQISGTTPVEPKEKLTTTWAWIKAQ